jgi:hypothetical protein
MFPFVVAPSYWILTSLIENTGKTTVFSDKGEEHWKLWEKKKEK